MATHQSRAAHRSMRGICHLLSDPPTYRCKSALDYLARSSSTSTTSASAPSEKAETTGLTLEDALLRTPSAARKRSNNVAGSRIRKYPAPPALKSFTSGEKEHDDIWDTQSPRIRKHIASRENDISRPKLDFEVLDEVSAVRSKRLEARRSGRTVGLVPTMGSLHKGHLDLMRAAARKCDEVWVSIFVNPTQFGPNEDFETYPRTMDEDLRAIKTLNEELQWRQYRGKITAVFSPAQKVLYPYTAAQSSHVAMFPQLSQVLEGKSRPNFFQGVTTIVTKLLNIASPSAIFFGQKDIQQALIIKRMIQEFFHDTEMVIVPTARSADGLALSSRNAYLGERRRAVATVLSEALRSGMDTFRKGSRIGSANRSWILDAVMNSLKESQSKQRALPPSKRVRFEIDYISLASPENFQELDEVDPNPGAILSGAMTILPLEEPQPQEKLGTLRDVNPVRLIDNMLLGDAYRDLDESETKQPTKRTIFRIGELDERIRLNSLV